MGGLLLVKAPPLPGPGWRLLEGNELPVAGDKGYLGEELGWETINVPSMWLAGGERIEGSFFARKITDA